MSDNTPLDRILAIVSLLVLAGYLGILVWWVPQPALTLVCLIVVALAAVDFYRMAFQGKS